MKHQGPRTKSSTHSSSHALRATTTNLAFFAEIQLDFLVVTYELP